MVGFTMLQIPDKITLDSKLFYKPYLAVVPYIKTSYQSVNAVCLSDDVLYPDNDLALPLSILWTGAAGRRETKAQQIKKKRKKGKKENKKVEI